MKTQKRFSLSLSLYFSLSQIGKSQLTNVLFRHTGGLYLHCLIAERVCPYPGVTAVALDPDTAYPRLWVSPCRTQVSVGDIQPNLPNNPERFTRYNIVLGSRAFTSGRHYWEVEVGSKTAWGLGVAAASVNRKEEVSLCPDDGFWTLVMREGLLHPGRPPRRVGVYLDYEGGVVAFYDTADMSHLFTFSNPDYLRAIISLTK
uniref:B30.2/SPRY domain-containing protein n=1 Tax=Esox lucius TaxID=8010 RepID=A0A3P8Z7Z3_ESOLU